MSFTLYTSKTSHQRVLRVNPVDGTVTKIDVTDPLVSELARRTPGLTRRQRKQLGKDIMAGRAAVPPARTGKP